MTTVLLDTHVLHWWTSDSKQLSERAVTAIESADVHAVAAITWFELAWLAHNGRIAITLPVRAWLDELSGHVETVSVDPAIATRAVALPRTFPGDPADRIIYATAVERGWQLVTRDESMRKHKSPRPLTIW